MSKIYPNPAWKPVWTEEKQNEYLRFCYLFYFEKYGEPNPPEKYFCLKSFKYIYSDKHELKLTLLQNLYDDGIFSMCLKMSFFEFCYKIKNGKDIFFKTYFKKQNFKKFREKQKFVRKPHHKKKDSKNTHSWRKKEKRDYKRSPSKARQFSRKKSAKRHRMFERECIKHERFDELGNNSDKFFYDPWDWD
jgi:hypothetical protein